jgi:hypothetical protein
MCWSRFDSIADRSNAPTSKSLVITITPSTDSDAAAADVLREAQVRKNF